MSLAELLGPEFIYRLDEGVEYVEQAVKNEFGIDTSPVPADNAYDRAVNALNPENAKTAEATVTTTTERQPGSYGQIPTSVTNEDEYQKQLLAEIYRIHESNPPTIEPVDDQYGTAV